ncbi:MAG TPA: DUF2793 domain-containing protein, partial [Xanthobacteraceae bacterium]|nr:DUF2793 domain-containing protein [Xanthobacteraceae bacterium]
TPALDQTAITIGTSSSTLTLGSIPNGVSVVAMLNVEIDGVSSVYFRNPSDTDLAPSGTAAPLGTVTAPVQSNGFFAQIRVRTNASQQIAARSTVSTTPCYIATLGWRDPRRRLF